MTSRRPAGSNAGQLKIVPKWRYLNVTAEPFYKGCLASFAVLEQKHTLHLAGLCASQTNRRIQERLEMLAL
jgi:hypothetical protein